MSSRGKVEYMKKFIYSGFFIFKGGKGMKNNMYYTQEGSDNSEVVNDYEPLMQRIIEMASHDLLEEMAQENALCSKVVILSTPKMGICNDIPKDKHGKPLKGKEFEFPKHYKQMIMKKFKKLKGEEYIDEYDN